MKKTFSISKKQLEQERLENKRNRLNKLLDSFNHGIAKYIITAMEYIKIGAPIGLINRHMTYNKNTFAAWKKVKCLLIKFEKEDRIPEKP